MLGTADDQHLLGLHRQPTTQQMTRHRCPLMQPTGVRLIAQQRRQVAGQRQLTQCGAQQVGLAL